MAEGALPAVSVLVLNHNGREHLEACLPSLEGQTYPPNRYRIEVIDNGSTDDSVAFVTEAHPRVAIRRLDRNYGFAGPYDQAIRASTSELVALLNNDTRVEPTWLAELVSAMRRHDAACAASRILDWDGRRIDFVGGQLSFVGHAWQRDNGAPASREYDESRLLFACGGSMAISREAYLDAGGFDQDFFAYFEDVDLGWRLSLLGYSTVLAPRAVTYHRLHGTAGRIAFAQRLRLYERNALSTIYKNYDDESLARVLPAAIALSLLRGLGPSGLDPHQFAFGAAQPPVVELPAQTAVHLIALEDFCGQLPSLREKRADIQRRRRVSDREIAALFGDPFRLHAEGVYGEAARALIKDFDIESLFGGASRSAGSRPASGGGTVSPVPSASVAMGESLPTVSIVILTLLGPTHLADCLPSLAAQTYPADRIEVIVVDNGSVESPADLAQTLYPGVRVIRNPVNLGFAAANNIGLRAARGDYVAFLNDDTRVDPEWLKELVVTAIQRRAAIAGSRILSWDGERIDFAAGAVSFEGKGFQVDHGLPQAGRYTSECPLLFACGAAMLARRDVLVEAGGWDEGTFAYYEDVELGWRMWLLGHEVWLSPGSVVYHKHHGTSGTWPAAPRLRLYERNSLRMLYTHLERATLERVLPASLLLSADRALLATDLSRAGETDGVGSRLRTGGVRRSSRVRRLARRTKLALGARGARGTLSIPENLRRVGIRGLLGAARQVARESMSPAAATSRLAYRIERGASPLSLDGRSERFPIQAAATLCGLREFIESLPELHERRCRLQSARRRTDHEILSRFGQQWLSPSAAPHLEEHHYLARLLVEELGIEDPMRPATRETAR